jgi:hypothetical protein
MKPTARSRGLMARHDLQRLVDAMLVAGLKVGAHDNIAERDRRLHKHNAGRFSSAEQSQDFGEEVQAGHFEAFEVRSGRIGKRDHSRRWITIPPKFGSWAGLIFSIALLRSQVRRYIRLMYLPPDGFFDGMARRRRVNAL